MKFIRQADMSATHVAPDGEECWIPPHYVEEPLVEVWLAATARHGTPMLVEEAPDGAFFDPGGMISMNEPRVSVVVNGQTLGSWLRGVDSLLPALRRTGQWGADFAGPPHVLVRGRCKHVLLTPETAHAAADLFAAEAERRAAECDAAHAARDAVLLAHGIVDRMAERNPVEALQQEARRAASGPVQP